MAEDSGTQYRTFRERILQHRIPLDVTQVIENGTPCELVLEKNRFLCQVPRGEVPIMVEIHFHYHGYLLLLSLAENFPFTQPFMMIYPHREDETLRAVQETTPSVISPHGVPGLTLHEVAENICNYLEPTTDDLRKGIVSIKEFVEKNKNRIKVSDALGDQSARSARTDEEILIYFRKFSTHSPAMRLHTMVEMMKCGVDMVLRDL